MGAYLSEPIRTKFPVDDSNERLEIGASSMQGWRIAQEDTHNCLLKFDKDTCFFAVYDGHGGAEVAQYTAEHLPNYVKNLKSYKEGKIGEALVEAFLEFDQTLVHDDIQEKLKALAGLETDEEADDEEEAAKLFEEADMPLDQLLQRYKKTGGEDSADPKHIRKLQDQKKGQLLSPMLPAKKDAPASSCDENGSVKVKLDLANCHNGEGENLPDSSSHASKSGQAGGDAEVSGSKDKSDGVTCSSDSGISVSASNSDVSASSSSNPQEASEEGSSAVVTSSECGGSSASGSGGSSGSTGQDEPCSSSGRTRKKKSGVIPAEGEDESSFDEDEEDTDEDSEEEEEKMWSSGSDSEDSEDGEVGGPFGGDGDEEEEQEVVTGGEEPGYDSGCTAVVSVLQGDKLYVANAGDSRCVLCRAGKAVDLSEDHKPEDTIEKTRILKAGGRITMDGRVNGGLNLSRAIGDHRYKMREDLPPREQMISAEPDIQTITIQPDDEFLVLACDGIWNAMSSQDVVTFVRERLQAGVRPLSDICAEMFELFLAPDTKGDGLGCDNMTCIIVNLRPKGTPVSSSSSSSAAAESKAQTGEVSGSSEAEAAVDSSDQTSKRKAEEDLIDSSDSKKSKVDDADSSG